MFSQNGSGEGQPENSTDTDELIRKVEEVLAALDAAGEKIAAAYVDMARNVLTGRTS